MTKVTTQDYNEKLAQDYEEIRDKVERGMLPLVARIPAIDKAVSDYVMARDEHLESMANPPIAYRDSNALDRYADLILYEELKWSHPDKMTIVDYPIMSDWQEIERDKKHMKLEEITYGGRRHNGRKKTPYFGKDGEVGVSNPKMVDKDDVDISVRETEIDVMALLDGAKLTERQRKAIDLVYFGDMTQEQAAEVMGVSKSNVNEYIRHGLTKIRRNLTRTS